MLFFSIISIRALSHACKRNSQKPRMWTFANVLLVGKSAGLTLPETSHPSPRATASPQGDVLLDYSGAFHLISRPGRQLPLKGTCCLTVPVLSTSSAAQGDSFPSRGTCCLTVPMLSTSSVAQGDSFPSRGTCCLTVPVLSTSSVAQGDSFPSRGTCCLTVPVLSTSSVAQGDSFPSRGSRGGARQRSHSGTGQLQRGSPSASRARAMHPLCIVRRATMPQQHGVQLTRNPA